MTAVKAHAERVGHAFARAPTLPARPAQRLPAWGRDGASTTRRYSASTPKVRRAGNEPPFWMSSIEIKSGVRMKAMWPSRGGRLMVTPAALSLAQVA